MHRLTFCLLFVVFGMIFTAHSQAQNPSDLFKAGEFERTMYYVDDLSIYEPSELTAKFAAGRQMYSQAGAPPKMLADYNDWSKKLLSLPFKKDFNSWTKAQQDLWNKTSLNQDLLDAWLGSEGSKSRFFYYLGNDTLYLAKIGQLEMNQWNYTLADVQKGYKNTISDFVDYRDAYPDVFQQLSSPVQDAIKAIAKYNATALDPMGNGVTADDITAIQTQAAIILDAANNNQLTH